MVQDSGPAGAIEITPAMLEAGRDVLWPFLAPFYPYFWHDDEAMTVLKQVLEASLAASRNR